MQRAPHSVDMTIDGVDARGVMGKVMPIERPTILGNSLCHEGSEILHEGRSDPLFRQERDVIDLQHCLDEGIQGMALFAVLDWHDISRVFSTLGSEIVAMQDRVPNLIGGVRTIQSLEITVR